MRSAIERQGHHLGRDRPVAHLDGEDRTRFSVVGKDISHRNGPPDRRRMRPGGNETGGPAIALNGIPVTGDPSTGDDEAHEALRDPALRHAGERGAPNEVAWLVELHDASKA